MREVALGSHLAEALHEQVFARLLLFLRLLQLFKALSGCVPHFHVRLGRAGGLERGRSCRRTLRHFHGVEVDDMLKLALGVQALPVRQVLLTEHTG
jgi:hypothetical protein